MERLLETFRSALDGSAILLSWHDNGDQWADFAWPWPSELRPNRKSRTLRIAVSLELLEDLANLPPDQQDEVFRRIHTRVARKAGTFEREHDTPRDAPTPIDELRITAEILG